MTQEFNERNTADNLTSNNLPAFTGGKKKCHLRIFPTDRGSTVEHANVYIIRAASG